MNRDFQKQKNNFLRKEFNVIFFHIFLFFLEFFDRFSDIQEPNILKNQDDAFSLEENEAIIRLQVRK